MFVFVEQTVSDSECSVIQSRIAMMKRLLENQQLVTEITEQARKTNDLSTLQTFKAQIESHLKDFPDQDVSPPETMSVLSVVTDKPSMEAVLNFGKLEVKWVPFSVSQTSNQSAPAAASSSSQTSTCPAPPSRPLLQTRTSLDLPASLCSPVLVQCSSTSSKPSSNQLGLLSSSSQRVNQPNAPAMTTDAANGPTVQHPCSLSRLQGQTQVFVPVSKTVKLNPVSILMPPTAGQSLNVSNALSAPSETARHHRPAEQESDFVPGVLLPAVRRASAAAQKQRTESRGAAEPTTTSEGSNKSTIQLCAVLRPASHRRFYQRFYRRFYRRAESFTAQTTFRAGGMFTVLTHPEISPVPSSLKLQQQNPVVRAVADSPVIANLKDWTKKLKNLHLYPGVKLKRDAEEPELSDRDAEEPELSDRDAEEPELSDRDAEEPELSDRDAEEPELSDRDAEEPELSDRDAEEPELSDRDAEEPELSDRDAEEPELSDRDAEEPELSDTESEAAYFGCSPGPLQPRVSLFRLPVSPPRPGSTHPGFRLVPGDAEDEIYLEEMSEDSQSNADDVTDDNAEMPPSSPESPVVLTMVTCSACRSACGSIVCTACGRGYHRDCHVPPIRPEIWSEWICSLCQDLTDPSDPFSSDRPQRPRSLSLPDQRRCESLLLQLKVEGCARLSQSQVMLMSERLIGVSPSYQTAEDFISDVWNLFKDASQDDVDLNKLQQSLWSRWTKSLELLPSGSRDTDDVRRLSSSNASDTRGTAKGSEVKSKEPKVTSRESKLKETKKRLKDFLDQRDTPQSKRTKTDDCSCEGTTTSVTSSKREFWEFKQS
ncbi:uncharacterized protein trim33l [Plectropomus leopardus]|uniref:uncharacterized protein trim33l n=1 Tax=Plectropomus leopardus TaxID=160734 RepID=UPI001C4D2E63|nr:uncharacterized protein trim33l [Plectropomus leopardus]